MIQKEKLYIVIISLIITLVAVTIVSNYLSSSLNTFDNEQIGEKENICDSICPSDDEI